MAWHYLVGSDKFGPVRDADLVMLFRSGQLNRASMLWREGMTEWRPAFQAPGLPAGCVDASPPPPPPPAGAPLPPVMSAPVAPSGEDAAISMLLPVGVDGFALAAGYLAFLSPLMVVALFPGLGAIRIVFPIPGLLGCVLGVIALNRLKQNPSARGKVRAWLGLAVPAATFVVVAVLAVLIYSRS